LFHYLKQQGKEITVLIGFKLFIAKKTQQKKKLWGAVNSSHEFPVTVVIGETSFEAFQKMVASACNEKFPNTGPIILKGLTN
jgi:hypothetical protein